MVGLQVLLPEGRQNENKDRLTSNRPQQIRDTLTIHSGVV